MKRTQTHVARPGALPLQPYVVSDHTYYVELILELFGEVHVTQNLCDLKSRGGSALRVAACRIKIQRSRNMRASAILKKRPSLGRVWPKQSGPAVVGFIVCSVMTLPVSITIFAWK